MGPKVVKFSEERLHPRKEKAFQEDHTLTGH